MTLTNTPPFVTEALLEEIRSWVVIESPTDDAAAVNRMADKVAADAVAAGTKTTRFPGTNGFGDHLLVTSPWGAEDEPGILLLSHLDTVHGMGTLDGALRYRVEGDVAYGPGIYDMKGGAMLGLAALRHLVRSGATTPLPVRQLFVADEEMGSNTSRALIEQEARRAKFVLVTEPARNGGRIVTARKGTARFDLHITGRASHSGTNHSNGRSAIRELARQVLDIEAMTDYATGLTVNVGVVAGGSRANIVAPTARAEIDMRVPDAAVGDAAMARLMAIRPYDPDVTLVMEGGLNRPAFTKSDDIAQLFEHARTLAAEIGFELEDEATGGGSDGNFTAAMGIPTLDGLGVDGKAAHTHDEQMIVSSLVPRATLLLRLMQTLT
ncbi:M20 family metallopeptidase [Acidisphaera sp. L21]|uniref:M20 family metallopeptidase n=1 Tax=Acidisphaera sp. L21 TaxID=1641851 RepID=UPI00131CF0AB|nr:M20 family metallopeptidase [Acidisphaera sp. L21]